jgi:hypothetical protein
MVEGSKPNNGDNLNNIKHQASWHFRNKQKEYLKDIVNELTANSKKKNVRELYKK